MMATGLQSFRSIFLQLLVFTLFALTIIFLSIHAGLMEHIASQWTPHEELNQWAETAEKLKQSKPLQVSSNPTYVEQICGPPICLPRPSHLLPPVNQGTEIESLHQGTETPPLEPTTTQKPSIGKSTNAMCLPGHLT